jgi:hypothetical protein
MATATPGAILGSKETGPLVLKAGVRVFLRPHEAALTLGCKSATKRRWTRSSAISCHRFRGTSPTKLYHDPARDSAGPHFWNEPKRCQWCGAIRPSVRPAAESLKRDFRIGSTAPVQARPLDVGSKLESCRHVRGSERKRSANCGQSDDCKLRHPHLEIGYPTTSVARQRVVIPAVPPRAGSQPLTWHRLDSCGAPTACIA